MAAAVQTLAQSNVTAINNLGTSSILVIGPNPSRSGIIFHNPGSNAVVVFPQYVLVNGQSVLLSPTTALLGGGFNLISGASVFIGAPTAAQSWQALALTGSGNPLTILEQT